MDRNAGVTATRTHPQRAEYSYNASSSAPVGPGPPWAHIPVQSVFSASQPRDAYWWQDLSQLWADWRIIPGPAMTNAQRINALARFVIVVAVILLLIKGGTAWLVFLVVGLVLTLVLSKLQQTPGQVIREEENSRLVEHYQCQPPTCSGFRARRST